MKLYLVRMGENFETAKKNNGNNHFSSLEQASDWAKLNFQPGQRFWICDENGGVIAIGVVPQIVGNA